MLIFSACIEMLSPPIEFYERFRIAKESGFNHIEFWGWEGKDLKKVNQICHDLGLRVTSISGDADQWSLCDDSHMKEYIKYAERSMEAARIIGCDTIVIHSNALGDRGVVLDSYPGYTSNRLYMNMLRTLLKLAPVAEKFQVNCVLEPLNTMKDHRGNLLKNIDEAAELVRLVGSPRINVLYDFYHMQIDNGDLINTFERNIDVIKHIHIADHPGRNEPGTGEINYKNIFKVINNSYEGCVAFELEPATSYKKAVEAIMQFKMLGLSH
ncbi:MAG: TIM barrel protein [Bacillota bacterium]|nr:TIM barrel protein [Bacillota bacterium]